jgi:hypothetical protein
MDLMGSARCDFLLLVWRRLIDFHSPLGPSSFGKSDRPHLLIS